MFIGRYKKLFPILIIIFIAAVIRILYYYHFPGIQAQPDTWMYYYLGRQMMTGNFLKYFVNNERTPVYPLFLNMISYFSGSLGAPMPSDLFSIAMEKVILVQTLIGIIGISVFYITLRIIGLSAVKSFLITLFTSCNLLVFGWERILLTESLGTFFLIFLFFVIIRILKQDKVVDYIYLLFLLVAGFLLKPFYLFLPFFVFPVIVYYRRNKTALWGSIIVIAGFSLSVLFYIERNSRLFDYRGINKISEINMLGKILELNLNVEPAKEVPYLYNNVKEYRAKGGEPMPYRFLEKYYFYDDPVLFRELGKFNSLVIKGNFMNYFTGSLMQIPRGLVYMSELYILKRPRESILGDIFLNIAKFYKIMQYLNFIIFFSFPVTLYSFITGKSFRYAVLALLGVISLYQIFFSVFFSYGEFGRLISSGLPLIFLYSLFSYWEIFKKINSYRTGRFK